MDILWKWNVVIFIIKFGDEFLKKFILRINKNLCLFDILVIIGKINKESFLLFLVCVLIFKNLYVILRVKEG